MVEIPLLQELMIQPQALMTLELLPHPYVLFVKIEVQEQQMIQTVTDALGLSKKVVESQFDRNQMAQH